IHGNSNTDAILRSVRGELGKSVGFWTGERIDFGNGDSRHLSYLVRTCPNQRFLAGRKRESLSRWARSLIYSGLTGLSGVHVPNVMARRSHRISSWAARACGGLRVVICVPVVFEGNSALTGAKSGRSRAVGPLLRSVTGRNPELDANRFGAPGITAYDS